MGGREPWEAEQQQIADFWSKVEDNSQWELHPELFAAVVARGCQQGRAPTVDCFADAVTKKLEVSY